MARFGSCPITPAKIRASRILRLIRGTTNSSFRLSASRIPSNRGHLNPFPKLHPFYLAAQFVERLHSDNSESAGLPDRLQNRHQESQSVHCSKFLLQKQIVGTVES